MVDEKAKLIILGSMPGVESLRQNQYYAHKRNQFWDIIYGVFDEEKEEKYSDRVKFLNKKNIALWDVIKQCEREGSLDANIRNEEMNNLKDFFNKYTNIQYVLFNGTTAKRLFKKYIGFNVPTITNYYQLPSTSPANTRPFKEKLQKWMIIKELLCNI
ncbi:DNA-deoxyinosine glycosylase [Caldisalinibacter kiritimatiensis]|nr:DNA-deoxyinosine glycosylase [Caldisalinibacter kiritimatiensis]